METITSILRELPNVEEAYRKLHTDKKSAVSILGVNENARGALISALSGGFKGKLIVTHSDLRANELLENYRLFDKKVVAFPAKDLMFYQADIRGNELTRERMKCIRRILEGRPVTVITTFDALLSPQIPLRVYKENILEIDSESVIEEKAIASKLALMGYEKAYQVEQPGQFSIRGGIIDIFELTEENPYRIELWGDDVESIRSFDVLSQRSLEVLSSITIYPATEMMVSGDVLDFGMDKILSEGKKQTEKLREAFNTEEAHRLEGIINQLKEEVYEFKNYGNLEGYINYFYEDTASLLELLNNESSAIFFDDPFRINEHVNALEMEFNENMSHRLEKGYVLPGQLEMLYSVGDVMHRASEYPVAFLSELPMKSALETEYIIPAYTTEIKTKAVSSYNSSFESLVKDLQKYKTQNYRVMILSGSRTRSRRLAEDLIANDITAFYTEDPFRELKLKEIETFYGSASKGYEFPDCKFAVISETDIFGTRKDKKKQKKRFDGQAIKDFGELKVGDYVVHEMHGLGIYRGIEQIVVEGVTKDYIKIEYRDGGSLYVLATNLAVLQKYASADAAKPKLNKLGTQEWEKTRQKVQKATEEVARDLVELYAARQSLKGHHYGADTVWQKEFEEMFPYDETDDQLLAIDSVKRDMESDRIMDRLICGDVGFGKTEIAIRAAFKAVQEGKQVVYLVPTTILAQQHYDTFRERMKNFPIRVDLLSRFCTASSIKNTIKELKNGMVDIVIGTHRVLSKDVEFKDLGLLIIDEEQRFGVTHKEKIKKMRESVDVLTLSATPIPRTLHMSLIGIRDMSVLEEAPNERKPIQTYVMEYNEEMVREAIVRELSRQGQVYYVYNRVNTIADMAADLQKLVPEARIAFAHGQMNEKELEYIMYQFINHEIDVLVSTTIIETGMDISNVNTMIIHDSDKLGLSQLYQLRGRVGRSDRTAYAFLMYKRDRLLREEAEKRLSAIKEFTDLGSGYKIAMKDLEIRGAGNMLGKSQHGHMQAVGYDLYCKMLNEAVGNLKGIEKEESFDTLVDLDVDAYIPSEYIVNEIQKLDIYKRIAGIEDQNECDSMKEELMDRFGKVPPSALSLLRVSMIRVKAHELFMTEVKGRDGVLVFNVKRDAALSPDGVIELFKKYEKLSFNNKLSQFIYHYKKTGFVDKDERELLDLVDNLLKDMKENLLKSQ